ncbi:acyl-CoA reductase [Bacillus sp. CGMCC 1.16607]|uniref:acyl-CoA reductase n=1 Tax=Bacillus sp. CGMCC 1.16607 TaxID=3351842 RepID=UPI0036281A38
MKFFWPLYSKQWEETIDSVVKSSPLSPFHPEVLMFLQSISKTILKEHTYRKFPELIALAYWLRKAHLHEMKELYEKQTQSKMVVARGTALHFAPSNVDTIFVYSWVLSLLAGNNNILRISGRKQEQTELLIDAIINGLDQFPEVAKRTAILTYEHQKEITQFLSERCHIRVIWGGDETVKTIRAIPLAPLATELAFPDRFSLSVLDAKAILAANEVDFQNVIHRFYNDGFWFAQMACSSPRMIGWIGEKNKIDAAQQKFWDHLDTYLNEQLTDFSPALQVQKLTTGYLLSASDHSIAFQHQPNFSRLKIQHMSGDFRERHCGGGLFLELELSELNALIPFLDDKDQTLSYFGFTHEQLVNFAGKLVNRSIDRIVPIGQALDFEGVWDGHDLLMRFMREIVIR